MKMDRRRALQTTAAVLTAASLLKLGKRKGALTLVDATLTESELRVAGASGSGRAHPKAIQPDLVRQWRDGLGAEVAAAETVMAYVRWDKALLLVGLAREARIKYRAVQIDRSVFAVRLSTLG